MTAFGQRVTGEVMPQAPQEVRQVMACGHLEFGDGIAHNLEDMHKTDGGRVKAGVCGDLVHQEAQGVMGKEQGVEFLDHADGLEAAQWPSRHR